VLVSTSAPGSAQALASFARAAGGPGAMALTDGDAAPAGDGSLAKPFTDEQLRVSVRRVLSRVQKAAAEAAAVKAASAGAQLTSQDLFGDLLAEVEEEAARPVRPAPARPATSNFDRPSSARPGWLARTIPMSSRRFPLSTLAVNMTLPSRSGCWLLPSSPARRPRPATGPVRVWSSVSPSRVRTRPTTVSRVRRRSPMAPSAGRHTTATPCRGLA